MTTTTQSVPAQRVLEATQIVIGHALGCRSRDFDPDTTYKAVAHARTTLTADSLEALPGLTPEILQAYRDVRAADESILCWALYVSTPVLRQAEQRLQALAADRNPGDWVSLVAVRSATDGIGRGTLDILLQTMLLAGDIALAPHYGHISDELAAAAIEIDGHQAHKLRFLDKA